MKVNLLPRTNIEKALSKSRRLTQSDHYLSLENYLKSLGVKNIKNFGNLKFTKSEFNFENNLDKNLSEILKNRKGYKLKNFL